MGRSTLIASLLGALVVVGVATGCAQSSTPTVTPSSMTKEEFIRTHDYDHVNQVWVRKGGGNPAVPPPSVKSREQVKAETEAFLSKNRWDSGNSRWVPLDQPRQVSTMSRDEVKRETEQFLNTHTYDERSERWVPKP
jgi:hypothetical protein